MEEGSLACSRKWLLLGKLALAKLTGILFTNNRQLFYICNPYVAQIPRPKRISRSPHVPKENTPGEMDCLIGPRCSCFRTWVRLRTNNHTIACTTSS